MDLHGVDGHSDGVEQLGERQAVAGSQPGAEVLALERHRKGDVGGDLDQPRQRDQAQPVPVVAELGFVKIEKGRRLPLIGGEVLGDVLVRKVGPLVRTTARVTDLGRHVPNDEHDQMAHALEAAQHQHRDGVADMQFGARGVDPELGNKGPALFARFLHPLSQRLRRRLELLATLGHERRLFGRRQVAQVHPPAGVRQLQQLADHVNGAQVSLYQ